MWSKCHLRTHRDMFKTQPHSSSRQVAIKNTTARQRHITISTACSQLTQLQPHLAASSHSLQAHLAASSHSLQPHLVASSHSLQPPASTSCRFRACAHIFGAVRYTSSDARDDSSSLAPMGTRFWHTPHPGARSIITPNAGSNTPAYSNLQSSTQRSTYKYADEKQHHFWVRKNSRPTPHVNDQANVITLPRQCDHKLHFA